MLGHVLRNKLDPAGPEQDIQISQAAVKIGPHPSVEHEGSSQQRVLVGALRLNRVVMEKENLIVV